MYVIIMKTARKFMLFVALSLTLIIVGTALAFEVITVNTVSLDDFIKTSNVFTTTRTAFLTNGTSISAPLQFYRSSVEWNIADDQFNWTYNPINTTTNPAGGSTFSLVINITDGQVVPESYEIFTKWLNLSTVNLVTARNSQFPIHFYYLPKYPENGDYVGALQVASNTTTGTLVDVGLIFFNSSTVTDFIGNVANVSITPVTVGTGKNMATWFNISFTIKGYNTNIYENFTTDLKLGLSYNCVTCLGAPTGNYYYLINHE